MAAPCLDLDINIVRKMWTGSLLSLRWREWILPADPPVLLSLQQVLRTLKGWHVSLLTPLMLTACLSSEVLQYPYRSKDQHHKQYIIWTCYGAVESSFGRIGVRIGLLPFEVCSKDHAMDAMQSDSKDPAGTYSLRPSDDCPGLKPTRCPGSGLPRIEAMLSVVSRSVTRCHILLHNRFRSHFFF
jgi:hypothetical protein